MKTIYLHNPRCTKSRQGIEILSKKNITFEIVEYLKEPLTKKQLEELFDLLNKSYEIKQFTRTKEKEFSSDIETMNKKSWVQLIYSNPKLIERPILFNNKKAIIGRPPEDLLSF